MAFIQPHKHVCSHTVRCGTMVSNEITLMIAKGTYNASDWI